MQEKIACLTHGLDPVGLWLSVRIKKDVLGAILEVSMSTIADYSVFTKAFLASGMTDFSQLYGNTFPGEAAAGAFRAFAVIPFNIEHPLTPLTPREAMNFDLSKLGLTSASGPVSYMARRVSCRDADGNFIGNIVRVQPSERDGSIRFVAKVAVPDFVSSETENGSNPADAPYNTFVLVRTDPSTNIDLPIAVATISKGYNLHKHKVVVAADKVGEPWDDNFADPLDDVENANYVSFTINNLNGYTSVDFNPDAYATYDDVANALSRGIEGLHIAFDTASGDLKLLDKDGNVLDQANLPIKTDVIIADGEEGYKYVKTDVKQDIHAAKAWMPEGFTAWETVQRVDYTMRHAALVVGKGSSRVFVTVKPAGTHPISTERVQFEHVVIDGSTYMLVEKTAERCHLLKVKGEAVPKSDFYADILDGSVQLNGQSYPIMNEGVEVDVTKEGDATTYVLVEHGPGVFQARSPEGKILGMGSIETSEDPSTGEVLGIALVEQEGTKMYTFGEGVETTITSISKKPVKWFGKKDIPAGTSLKYGLEAFVWTVKGAEDTINDSFFKQLNDSLLALGFHEGDDIALGTNLATLAPTEGASPLNGVDANDYMHGETNKATREQEVDAQRANAKEELVAWNAQHPALEENRSHGTIIDSSGLDVRDGRITLGCGRIGEEGKFQKINYGIRMGQRFGVGEDPNTYESLDFTISHHTGKVQFDKNGHAAQPGGNDGLVPLTSSTLLSIEAGSYISGAPTCLILAEVTHNSDSEGGPTVLTPVRMTAGFSVASSYDASSGLTLTIQDYRDNIKAVLGPEHNPNAVPSIIEVQAIYTHRDALNETVPAQQMHTYIGSWDYNQAHPSCSFLCNKIEEWMTAVGLADTTPAEGVQLYVVIRVY